MILRKVYKVRYIILEKIIPTNGVIIYNIIVEMYKMLLLFILSVCYYTYYIFKVHHILLNTLTLLKMYIYCKCYIFFPSYPVIVLYLYFSGISVGYDTIPRVKIFQKDCEYTLLSFLKSRNADFNLGMDKIFWFEQMVQMEKS